METIKKYEHYPAGTVILSNFVSIAIYTIGFLIILKAGLLLAIAYLSYILILEIRLLKYHCTSCYYYGKTCAFGKGRISAWLFKQAEPSKFCAKKMTWSDMIPDIMVSLVPLATGIVLLIMDFNLIILVALPVMVLLTTAGNGYIRGTMTCNHCKQRDLGCPADQLFNKENLDQSR
jgi:hypothetical protein